MLGLPKIALGIIVALAVALAGSVYWLSNVIESRAAVRASLLTVIEANGSLVRERDTAKAEAARNQAISATALRENKALDEKVAAIRERLRNGQACLIDPADSDALDGLFR